MQAEASQLLRVHLLRVLESGSSVWLVCQAGLRNGHQLIQGCLESGLQASFLPTPEVLVHHVHNHLLEVLWGAAKEHP